MNLNVNIKSSSSTLNQRFIHKSPIKRHHITETSKKRANLNENKMAVVNLEAALTSWKSIQNHKVNQVSEIFRTNLASRIRLSPVSTGYLPGNLMRHYLG
jgi:hypothetical protein